MPVIGLTGGIASGKSLVSRILRELGAYIVDADEVARLVVNPGTPGWNEIRQFFGDAILDPDGTINRKALGSIVFAEPARLQKLNEITHPKILEYIKNEIDKYRKDKGGKALIVDVALLIESGLWNQVDEVWLVVVSQDVQLSRLMARDGIDRAQAWQRISSQMSVEEKKKYADVIIDNSGGMESTRQTVEALWNQRIRSGVEIIDN